VDLVLTDVVMPRLGGPALVEQLREGGSRVPVLFMSGYADDALEHHGAPREDVELIEKPFTPEALVARVRELLDRPERME